MKTMLIFVQAAFDPANTLRLQLMLAPDFDAHSANRVRAVGS